MLLLLPALELLLVAQGFDGIEIGSLCRQEQQHRSRPPGVAAPGWLTLAGFPRANRQCGGWRSRREADYRIDADNSALVPLRSCEGCIIKVRCTRAEALVTISRRNIVRSHTGQNETVKHLLRRLRWKRGNARKRECEATFMKRFGEPIISTAVLLCVVGTTAPAYAGQRFGRTKSTTEGTSRAQSKATARLRVPSRTTSDGKTNSHAAAEADSRSSNSRSSKKPSSKSSKNRASSKSAPEPETATAEPAAESHTETARNKPTATATETATAEPTAKSSSRSSKNRISSKKRSSSDSKNRTNSDRPAAETARAEPHKSTAAEAARTNQQQKRSSSDSKNKTKQQQPQRKQQQQPTAKSTAAEAATAEPATAEPAAKSAGRARQQEQNQQRQAQRQSGNSDHSDRLKLFRNSASSNSFHSSGSATCSTVKTRIKSNSNCRLGEAACYSNRTARRGTVISKTTRAGYAAAHTHT